MAAVTTDDGPNVVRTRIIVHDIKFQTLMTFRATDTVWAAKQQLLSTPVLKNLQDGLNYGLYSLPANGKAGKFLDEERQLKEYPFPGPVGVLEFKYKKRVYKTTPPDPVKMKKLHSSSNLKAFMEHVRKSDVQKISALTNKGFDPNYVDRSSGESPLSLSASLPRPRAVMLVLVSGGAILDYRNGRSLTAVHVAVMRGNRDALMTLLDLGASPNYKDKHGLTALYHAVTKDSQAGPQCVQMLLFNRSDIGVIDDSWNTELHQVCISGRVQHLEHLLFYGADINAQNTSGDTPLHVCAKYNQEECARVLLFRGADKTLRNKSMLDAFHAANSAGHTNLADVIRRFTPHEVVLFQELPTYNDKRRGTISAATLRNLQRSRSNPQLSLLFQSNTGDPAHSTGAVGAQRSETSPVRAAASLSSAYQHHSSHQHTEPTRSSILSNPDIIQSWKRGFLHNTSEEDTRTVVVRRDKRGFGFILRGAKSRSGNQTLLDFAPTSDFPSLQYFDVVEKNSPADLAGLCSGDFLLQVGDVSVVRAAHEYVVNLIKKAGDTLVLKVVRVQPPPRLPAVTDSTLGHTSLLASTTVRRSSRSVLDGLEELERLDATLDNYELEGRKPDQSSRTRQELMFHSSPNFVVQPVTGDRLVNGSGPRNTTFITHVDLHHAPETAHEVVTLQCTTPDEPEPDYDSKDEENGDIHVEGLSPPLTEVVGLGPLPLVEPPTPPPLPPPSSLGFSAGQHMSLATRGQSADRPEPAEVAAARLRDDAHAALIAAVQRRRHLLDNVDGEQIADSIENRVQRSKMLQTVYRADNDATPAKLCLPDESDVEHQPVGLLDVADQTPPATSTTSNGDFCLTAEQARLEYVRRLKPPPPPPPKQPPLMKPLRSQPPTAPKSLQNGGSQSGVVRTAGTAEPPRSVVVNESHNRALVEYVNGSSKVYTAAAATAVGHVETAARSFVHLHDAGESTTEPSPATRVTADGASHDRRLRIVTDDTASVLSSLSTLSTNSSVGVGGVGVGDGAVSPHGSPSQSSSNDSGFAKSSTTTGSHGDPSIIPPPSEFASSSDNSSSTSSTSVQTAVPTAALRSVARNQSHSMVFPARTQVTQK